jgi:hypothetical protein
MYSETVTVASACHRDGGPARGPGRITPATEPIDFLFESIFYFKF